MVLEGSLNLEAALPSLCFSPCGGLGSLISTETRRGHKQRRGERPSWSSHTVTNTRVKVGCLGFIFLRHSSWDAPMGVLPPHFSAALLMVSSTNISFTIQGSSTMFYALSSSGGTQLPRGPQGQQSVEQSAGTWSPPLLQSRALPPQPAARAVEMHFCQQL